MPPKSDPDTDLLLRETRFRQTAPWTPSYWAAFRLISFTRLLGALYSLITDCDEVYNYWEPLHFLLYGKGFQTWEYAPEYAIRSYAYVAGLLQVPLLAKWVVPLDKRVAFYGLRIVLGLTSTAIECQLYRTIVKHISPRVARYFLLFSLFSTGLWSSTTSILPSAFALVMTNAALTHSLIPVNDDRRRTLGATAAFVAGAIVGWPFAILLAVPFAFEELLVKGGSRVYSFPRRFLRFLVIGLLTTFMIAIPGIAVDSVFYDKPVFVAWNIVQYNVFSNNATLYGTEPWHYYLLSGLLNFNLVFLLALASAPVLAATHIWDRASSLPSRTTRTGLLMLRISPFYLWLAVLSKQPHKEERFLFPACSLTCFCAALSFSMLRNLVQRLYLKITGSPEKAARTFLISALTRSIIAIYILISVSRIRALYTYYKAPVDVLTYLQLQELPRLSTAAFPALHSTPAPSNGSMEHLDRYGRAQDFEPLRPLNLSLCYGSEWYRFPSHFLVPEPVTVRLVDVGVPGIMPKHFLPLTRLEATRSREPRFNDLNRPETDQYFDVNACSYYVVLEFPHRQPPTECVSCNTAHWDTVICLPFLDASKSNRLTRILHLPGKLWQKGNAFGRLCLLKSTSLP